MASSNFIVIFDSCIFYGASLRDFLMNLAAYSNLFMAKWTEDIHEEWISNLQRKRPEIKKENLERTRVLINSAVLDSIVDKARYTDLIGSLSLPDLNDCHVLAAAIAVRAELIITDNLKDFPDAELSKYQIRAISPDNFVLDLLNLDQDAVIKCIQMQQKNLKNPPITIEQLFAKLHKAGLIKSINHIRSLMTETGD